MPTRILREGILTSPRVNALSFGAELFYRRLMTVADDYGRYHASPATLRGACWPICPDKVTEKQITAWINECLASDIQLLSVYESGGYRYLQIANFGQQVRGKSKFPEPPSAEQLLSNRLATDKQMCSLVVVVGEGEGEGVNAGPRKKHRIDETTLPQDWHQWAFDKYNWDWARSTRTFEKFLNYWQSKGELRADWKASWRTWVMNDEERNPSMKPMESMYPNTRTSPDGYTEYQSKTGEWKR